MEKMHGHACGRTQVDNPHSQSKEQPPSHAKTPPCTQLVRMNLIEPAPLKHNLHPMLRKYASGPEIGLPGWISAGPEARFPARKHYCVT